MRYDLQIGLVWLSRRGRSLCSSHARQAQPLRAQLHRLQSIGQRKRERAAGVPFAEQSASQYIECDHDLSLFRRTRMRSRTTALLGAAALIAITPLGMSTAFAANAGANTSVGATGPNGSGSSEAETQGSAKHTKSHVHAHARAGAHGPTGSGSAEAETQGSGPKTKVHGGHAGGAVTNQPPATGSAGTR